MRNIWHPGESIPFMFPRYDGETATTAYLRRESSVNLETITVTTTSRVEKPHREQKMLQFKAPNRQPIGSFEGFATPPSALKPGEYYIVIDVTRLNEAGATLTDKRTVRFYLGSDQ